MQDRFDKLEEKLDKLAETQVDMRGDLREHMRRTAIAEDNIEKLAKAMEPVQLHVAFVRGFGKLLIALLGIGASAAAIWEVFIK